MTFTLSNWMFAAFYLALLIVGGAGEYLHIAPSGTFNTVLLLIIGHGSATTLIPGITSLQQESIGATRANTVATQANTAAQVSSPVPPTNAQG